jgi:hypothetical protein
MIGSGAGPYRLGDETLLLDRREALLAARRAEAADLHQASSPAAMVYSARVVRTAFGLAGVAMAVLLVDAALTGGIALTPILDASWLILGAVAILARPLAALALRAELGRAFVPSDDVRGDIATFELVTPTRVVADAADRLEERSVALPLSALGLLLPLTLHRLGAVLLDAMGVRMPLLGSLGATRPMDAWIKASMVMVGHCHVLLVILVCAFARDLRRHPDFPEMALGERAGWGAFAWTSLASIPAATLCLTLWPLEGWLPFILIPTLVTVTGLTFIPPSFLAMGRVIARERAVIRV